MININNNFGAILKELRKKSDRTLSEVKGITNSYTSRLENGQRTNPTVGVVMTLAANYNIAPKTLFKIICGIKDEENTTLNDILLKNDLIIKDSRVSVEIKLILVDILTLILNTEFNREDEANLLMQIDELKKIQKQENNNYDKIDK